ncbi:MAG: phage scaffolding protein [Bacteroidales bacterium]|nr:phage scaffolding protein [Bacteroidales bacterium]
MGLTKEQIDAIMATNGSDIENARSTMQKEIDGLNEQLKDRDKQLTDLKATAGDNESLAKQISDLQEANKQAAAAHESELNQLKIDFAVDKALTGAQAKNNKAVRALLDLTDAKFDKDGNVKGLQEQIDALVAGEDTKFLFNAAEPAKEPQTPQFVGFQPGQASMTPGSQSNKQAEYETRLAQARQSGNQAEAIRIKTEAFNNDGIVLN